MMTTTARQTNPIPSFPRYRFAIDIAAQFLSEEGISYFPVDPVEVIKRRGWKLTTYQKLAAKEGITDQLEVLILTKHVLGSGDAIAIKKGPMYAIAYNDHVNPQTRITFTLMHEIGHIILGHLDEFHCGHLAREGLTEYEYRILEDEADCFARNALTPAILAVQLKTVLTATTCRSVFGLSGKAWETRLSFLQNDYEAITQASKEAQREQYWGFITGKICCTCGNRIVGLRKGLYCPFCGGHKFKWEKDIMKYEVKYLLDESGRPSKCPVCGNEEVSEGEFCKICGAAIINRCTNYRDPNSISPDECGRYADGEARYCIYCGSETTYLKSRILLPWKGAKK